MFMKKIVAIIMALVIFSTIGTVCAFADDPVTETTTDYISDTLSNIEEIVNWWSSSDLPEWTITWLDTLLNYIQNSIVLLIDKYNVEYQWYLNAKEAVG